MNKTVNINLGGMFFHMDEDAYQKLTKYFEAIKRSLSNTSGQDEIIKDIEMRVSELLTEKQKTEKHVVTLKEVDEVITVMGQPEDYKIDDNETENNTSNFTTSKTRKLYRDKDNGMIGGVLAGLGHYFGIDKVWLRIFMLILGFVFGTGFLAYIILWIVMPEATTTAEKLEMTGEPVNIANIEKKVREEFENVSNKLKKVDYDKFGNEVKSVANKAGSSFGNFIIAVLRAFSKFLGVMLIITGLSILVALFIGVFTLGSSSMIDLPWQEFIEAGNFTNYPVWTFGLLMFFAVGIPFFFLTVLGFKLLSPNMKSIGNIAKYTLLAIWIIAVTIAILIGANQASAFSAEGRTIKKEVLNLKPTDTLCVKFKINENYSKDSDEYTNFKVIQDSTGLDFIYSNNVHFKIMDTDEKLAYIQIEKESKGKSFAEAKKRAEKIQYDYIIQGNNLILNNYLLTELKDKFRDQEIEITLFLPKGVVFKLHSNVENYDVSDDSFFEINDSRGDNIYKVGNKKVLCVTCPMSENEDLDSEDISENQSDSKNVTINGTGITINKNEIQIKTN